MKVLITNNHFHSYGGTESFNWTIYKELKRLKFDVDVYSKWDDEILYPFNEDFINKIDSDKEYDLVICSHNSTFETVIKYGKYKKLVHISHGKYHPIELPIKGADKYYSVSEEVKTFNLKKGFKSEVLLNPVDLDEYYPKNKLTTDISKVLSMCQNKYSTDKIKTLFKDCNSISTDRLERRRVTSDDYNQVNIVFGLGRSAYEALGCGRCVIIFDARDYMGENYDGIITNTNIKNLVQYNCSGRLFGSIWRIDRVIDQIEKFYVPDTEYYRSIAEKYFDSKKIVQKLIS